MINEDEIEIDADVHPTRAATEKNGEPQKSPTTTTGHTGEVGVDVAAGKRFETYVLSKN